MKKQSKMNGYHYDVELNIENKMLLKYVDNLQSNTK
jgi:hypothetical protein